MNEKPINHKQQPINGQPSGLKIPQKSKFNKNLLLIFTITIAVILFIIMGVLVWYKVQLSPAGSDISRLKKITIPPGSSSSQIGKQLKKELIIRDATAFDVYIRLSCKNNVLQAGTYRLSPAETVPQIIEHFVNGSVDKFSITFYPGATLTDDSNKAESKKQDVTTVLKRAGFSSGEIQAAIGKTYDSPLFAGKPASADLEGYVYGETYNFDAGSSVEDILNGTFSEFYSVIQKNDFIKKFANHDLNLYQGIILASIIQREANKASDQKQVAQVFYSRLKKGMMLGSDVTYQYIADKTGVARDPALDSPYNTRKYPGFPPGPIATPGFTALQAVANPASGDYLYFLSGDDDVTYFAKTNDEHEANIVNHRLTLKAMVGIMTNSTFVVSSTSATYFLVAGG